MNNRIPQLSTDELNQFAEPVEQCQSEIIYLQHPSEPRRLMLLRGTVADTLLRHGYIELTKEQYEADE